LLGGGLGLLLRGRISDKLSKSMMKALGLCIAVIGIRGAISGDVMLMVIAIALGAFIGEILRIEDGLNRLGDWTQSRLSRRGGGNSTFSQGFVNATLVFCVGAMAVVGSIDSGLLDDQSVIFTKSILDAMGAMVFASSLGVGVLFSAIPVLLYQGSIELFAGHLQHVFTPGLVMQISAVGGLMILGIGFNMVADAKIKVANLLPGFLIAVGYYLMFMR